MKEKKSKIIIDAKQYENIYDHSKSELLNITIDRLKLKLKEHEESLKYKSLALAFFSIILAILLTFATTNFKDALGLSAYTWQAFFLLVLVILSIVSIHYSVNWFRKKITIDKIIDDFKKKEEKVNKPK